MVVIPSATLMMFNPGNGLLSPGNLSGGIDGLLRRFSAHPQISIKIPVDHFAQYNAIPALHAALRKAQEYNPCWYDKSLAALASFDLREKEKDLERFTIPAMQKKSLGDDIPDDLESYLPMIELAWVVWTDR